MKIDPFQLERWQSENEHAVEINLSESGVEPLTVSELVGDDGEISRLLDTRLGYIQTDGSADLKDQIAALYPGASSEGILVTNGGSEANCVLISTLVSPGDEVVVLLPNYMQIPGWVRSLGAEVREWWLVPDEEHGRWRADLDALRDLVSDRTRLICLCTPNNPTGSCLDDGELDGICAIADEASAWVLSDEIYRGAELDGVLAPSVWGRSERAVVTSGLSKAYGLPGLRIGWLAGPADLVRTCWGTKDYTSIAPSTLGDRLGTCALHPSRRERLLSRTRDLLRGNLERVLSWVASRDDLSCIAPRAGAMCWVHYETGLGSTALCERLLEEHSVLLVPGDHYGLDHWMRIGFGGDPAELEEGLARIAKVLG